MERNHLILIALAITVIASGCAGNGDPIDEQEDPINGEPPVEDSPPVDEEDEDLDDGIEAPEDDLPEDDPEGY